MLLVNFVGILLIAFIIWWFWLYSPNNNPQTLANKSKREITVVVEDGVYQPSTVTVSADTNIILNFTRKDATPCAATLLFPDFEISAELPLNKSVAVLLPKMKKGKYPFHCQMQMYKGYLVVE